MTLQINFPNKEKLLGHLMTMSNKSIQFKPLETTGDVVLTNAEKQTWKKPLPKIHHAEHKLLLLPFY